MPTFTVRRGRRYRATISLGMLQSFANNETIGDRFRALGFTEVSVIGQGDTRTAEAEAAYYAALEEPAKLAA